MCPRTSDLHQAAVASRASCKLPLSPLTCTSYKAGAGTRDPLVLQGLIEGYEKIPACCMQERGQDWALNSVSFCCYYKPH